MGILDNYLMPFFIKFYLSPRVVLTGACLLHGTTEQFEHDFPCLMINVV